METRVARRKGFPLGGAARDPFGPVRNCRPAVGCDAQVPGASRALKRFMRDRDGADCRE
jgi:hypothetical protein